MVAAMDALRKSVDAGESIREKTSVAAYIQMRRTAPVNAKIRLILFMVKLLIN